MLSLNIALRYLLAKKSHSAVNIISGISVAGVAVATAAIVIVLSVFNGFTDLAASHYDRINPPLLVEPASAKVIVNADSVADRLAKLESVAVAMPSLTERALLSAGDERTAVVFKGVDKRLTKIIDVDSIVVDGIFTTELATGEFPAAITVGVATKVNLHPGMEGAELYVPRRIGRINPANPIGAFRSSGITPTAVIQIDQMDYDMDHMLIPLDVARDILMYDNGEATAIEIAPANGYSVDEARRDIADALGHGYKVKDRTEQQARAFHMIAIEKWVTFAMLFFILIIAAFNIISTISLMVIEKRENMQTLRSLGATQSLVRRTFMIQGSIITAAGGIVGCILGIALALAQQYGKFIKLAGDPSQMTISVYPVRVAFTDILAIIGILAVIALLTAQTTRLFTRKIY